MGIDRYHFVSVTPRQRPENKKIMMSISTGHIGSYIDFNFLLMFVYYLLSSDSFTVETTGKDFKIFRAFFECKVLRINIQIFIPEIFGEIFFFISHSFEKNFSTRMFFRVTSTIILFIFIDEFVRLNFKIDKIYEENTFSLAGVVGFCVR